MHVSMQEMMKMNNITTEMNPIWLGYDRSIALAQLADYGVIFLDAYGMPNDDEYEWDMLYEMYKRGELR